MSKLLVPLLKIFLRKISGNSIELHTDDLSEILVLQNLSENLSENLSQNDFRKVNRIEPLSSHPLIERTVDRSRTQSIYSFPRILPTPKIRKCGCARVGGDVYFCAKFRLMCRKGASPPSLLTPQSSLAYHPHLAQRFLHLDNSFLLAASSRPRVRSLVPR